MSCCRTVRKNAYLAKWGFWLQFLKQPLGGKSSRCCADVKASTSDLPTNETTLSKEREKTSERTTREDFTLSGLLSDIKLMML